MYYRHSMSVKHTYISHGQSLFSPPLSYPDKSDMYQPSPHTLNKITRPICLWVVSVNPFNWWKIDLKVISKFVYGKGNVSYQCCKQMIAVLNEDPQVYMDVFTILEK